MNQKQELYETRTIPEQAEDVPETEDAPEETEDAPEETELTLTKKTRKPKKKSIFPQTALLEPTEAIIEGFKDFFNDRFFLQLSKNVRNMRLVCATYEDCSTFIHLSDQSLDFSTDIGFLAGNDVMLPNQILIAECWKMTSLLTVLQEFSVSENLICAATFPITTPVHGHNKSIVVENPIKVNLLYLIVIIHKDNEYTKTQLSSLHECFSRPAGPYGKAENHVLTHDIFLNCECLPAQWWYEVFLSLFEVFVPEDEPIRVLCLDPLGFSWYFAALCWQHKQQKSKILLASFAVYYPPAFFDRILHSVTCRFARTDIEATFDSFTKVTGQKVKGDLSVFSPFTKAISKKKTMPKAKTPKVGIKRVAVRSSPRYPKKKPKKK